MYLPMREAFKERSHLVTSSMTEELYGSKTSLGYEVGSIDYFCTKKRVIFLTKMGHILLNAVYLSTIGL